jgi:catechol 2,3-dioxygenase-like lactoylglutathione lyase family enzyme
MRGIPRASTGENFVKIQLTSVMVEDQAKALAFYTETLGFVKKTDIPMGEFRWLTVVSPEGPDDIELVLEPLGFAPARTFQKALFEAGIPLTAFAVPDVQAEHDRLAKRGVVFKTGPAEAGGTTVAVFEDTCGNLIQIYQG